MNINNTPYYPGIDNAKAIGLWLMILGHLSLVDDNLNLLIYSFHMPLFFIISGFLFKYRSPKEQILRSWRLLMVPYLIINGIFLTISISRHFMRGEICLDYLYNHITPIFLGLGYSIGDLHPLCTPMWFFYVMFFLQIIISVIGDNTHRKIVATFFSIAATVTLHHLRIDTTIPVDSLFMALPFFYVGDLLKRILSHVETRSFRYLSLLTTPPIVWAAFVNGRVDINTCNFGSSLLLFYTVAIVLSVTIILWLKNGGGEFSIQAIFLRCGNRGRLQHSGHHIFKNSVLSFFPKPRLDQLHGSGIQFC